MPARLIVNADDFGLTRGVNRAVGELYAAGVLTSTTLMANGAAFEDAVQVALAHPGLGVGCHVVLTDGIPVSAPETIPSLMGADGKSFRPTLIEFLRAPLLGRLKMDEVAREAEAQIEKLQRAGIRVTHVDTHKHTHLFPGIARTLLQVAEQCGVRAVRNPFEPEWSLRLGQGSRGRRMAVGAIGLLRPKFDALIRAGHVLTTDGTVAISATGELDAGTLRETLRGLPETGTYELCCHPGYNDGDLDRVTTRLRAHRDVERESLLAEVPKALGGVGAPGLISYGSLEAKS